MSNDKDKEVVKGKQSNKELGSIDNIDTNTEFNDSDSNIDYSKDKPVPDVLNNTFKDESVIQIAKEVTEEDK